MSSKYIIAIVPSDLLEALERELARVHAPGLTASKVRGYGEYGNFFGNDWTSSNTKIEIFVDEASVEAIVQAIVAVAGSSLPGAGIVAVLPVERFFPLHLANGG